LFHSSHGKYDGLDTPFHGTRPSVIDLIPK
jgi:hypothetical protein